MAITFPSVQRGEGFRGDYPAQRLSDRTPLSKNRQSMSLDKGDILFIHPCQVTSPDKTHGCTGLPVLRDRQSGSGGRSDSSRIGLSTVRKIGGTDNIGKVHRITPSSINCINTSDCGFSLLERAQHLLISVSVENANLPIHSSTDGLNLMIDHYNLLTKALHSVQQGIGTFRRAPREHVSC